MTPEMLDKISLAELLESLLLSDTITQDKKEILRSSLSEILSQQTKARRKKWLVEKTQGLLVEIDSDEYDLSELVEIEWDSDGTPEGFFNADEWTLHFADGVYVTCDPNELPDWTSYILSEYAYDTDIWDYGSHGGVVIDQEFYCFRNDISSISWNGKKDEEDYKSFVKSFEEARIFYFQTKGTTVMVVFREEIEEQWMWNLETYVS